MKLHYYKPPDGSSNFGDELNRFIWNHYFPNFFDEDNTSVFFGIGTIMRAAKKIYPDTAITIFGSGAHASSQEMEPNFEVDFVRGPFSAKALGLDDTKWITDPAILTPKVFPMLGVKKRYKYSYMPHFSVANHYYKEVFESIGIHYIDPRDEVEDILERINATEVLLTEAMHGAILADAYRVPWLPVYSYSSLNHFKWKDWSESLGIQIRSNKIPRFYINDGGIKLFIKKRITIKKVKKICALSPYLSDAAKSKQALSRIEERIALFKEKHALI